MKKILIKAAVLPAFLLICWGIFLGTKYYYGRQVRTVEVIKEVNTCQVTEKEIQLSGETMRYELAGIGKLSTAEYTYTHVEQFESAREIQGYRLPFTSSTFLYSYDGTITAGIDFTRIQVDISDRTGRITVILPEAEILTSEVDQDSFELYDEKNNIFNPIHVSDVSASFAKLKPAEEQKAVEKGLLDTARANAVMLVKNFIHAAWSVDGYRIEVIFAPYE